MAEFSGTEIRLQAMMLRHRANNMLKKPSANRVQMQVISSISTPNTMMMYLFYCFTRCSLYLLVNRNNI